MHSESSTASSPDGQLLGFDLDPAAITIASQRLKNYAARTILVQASYTGLSDQLKRLNWKAVQGVVLDLGVSSMQFDRPERGFSFREDAPLDMRFDPDRGQSAADLLNTLKEVELADILWRYGEERLSRRIARAIVANRPVKTTRQLAELVKREYRGKGGHIHPATRSFQALRIAVNRELEALEEVLPQAMQALARARPAGRHIVSFAGRPNCQAILPARKSGLHLPARTTSLHLRAPGKPEGDHEAPAHPFGIRARHQRTSTFRKTPSC